VCSSDLAEQSDGTVILEVVRYSDFATNEFLREVPSGATQTIASPRLWQLHLDPVQGTLLNLDQSLDCSCEFPIVNPQDVAQPWRYTYFSTHRPGVDETQGELFGAIARLDRTTGGVTIADCGDRRYVSEPIYAPGSDGRGWILSVVFDGTCDRSEVWIHEAEGNWTEPICRLLLPEIVPLGFHGTWHPAKI